MPRGGFRVGAGRKPKVKLAVVAAPAVVSVPSPPPPSTNADAGGAESLDPQFHAPDALDEAERKVWLQLAPHAVARQTLTKATAYQFELLCRNIVLERAISRDVELRGGANHRGIIQRIDAELLRFDLAPNGKPHGAAAAPAEKPKTRLELLKDRRKGLHAVG